MPSEWKLEKYIKTEDLQIARSHVSSTQTHTIYCLINLRLCGARSWTHCAINQEIGAVLIPFAQLLFYYFSTRRLRGRRDEQNENFCERYEVARIIRSQTIASMCLSSIACNFYYFLHSLLVFLFVSIELCVLGCHLLLRPLLRSLIRNRNW